MLILKGPDDDMEDETEQGVTELVILMWIAVSIFNWNFFQDTHVSKFQVILSMAFVSLRCPLYE